MSVIYLSHPVHGRKVAVLELEAEYDEKNGWTRYTLDESVVDESKVKRRRGRPRSEATQQGT